MEPRGCPTPGACSSAALIKDLAAALEQAQVGQLAPAQAVVEAAARFLVAVKRYQGVRTYQVADDFNGPTWAEGRALEEALADLQRAREGNE